jgi:isopropylmalate/homocitrate/citramalate synthase
LTASEGFTKKNLHRTHAENLEAMKRQAELHIAKGIPVTRVGVMAAFGCNYQGDISPAQVVKTLDDGMKIAEETGATISLFSLADTMGWATPVRIERVIGAVREKLAGYEDLAAFARHARPGGRQRACRVEDGRHSV